MSVFGGGDCMVHCRVSVIGQHGYTYNKLGVLWMSMYSGKIYPYYKTLDPKRALNVAKTVDLLVIMSTTEISCQ